MKTLVNRLPDHARLQTVLFLAFAALGLPAQAMAQSVELTGEWILTVESPNGTGQRQVTFVQDGDSLSGEISSSQAAGLLTGTIDGGEVTFVATVLMDSGAFDITYHATVTGDEMSGTVDFGSYGRGTFTGRKVESSPR